MGASRVSQSQPQLPCREWYAQGLALAWQISSRDAAQREVLPDVKSVYATCFVAPGTSLRFGSEACLWT